MLNVLDCFSRFAWSAPLKDKTGLTVLNALKNIVEESKRKPNHLWVDQGREFYNKHFDEWLKENNVVRYSTFGEHKSAIVERFNRTLKTEMWKRFTAENTRNWIGMLDDLLARYNNKVHSTTKMTPSEASQKPQLVPKRKQNVSSKQKFVVGDTVRISRIKKLFERVFHPNWTEEVFTVVEVKSTSRVTYKLKDSSGEILSGNFYNEELQKRLLNKSTELKK